MLAKTSVPFKGRAMETFARGCVWIIELAGKAYVLLACIYFGSFTFRGFWGGFRFKPEFLPFTAFCVVFAYLMVAPRRWMPARWLQDVAYRRSWCVGLALGAPLYCVVAAAWREPTSLLGATVALIESLQAVAVIFAVLAIRWWAAEPWLSPALQFRLILLAVILWLTMVLDPLEGVTWFILVLLALLAAVWVTRKRPADEGDPAGANREQAP